MLILLCNTHEKNNNRIIKIALFIIKFNEQIHLIIILKHE